jgi:hypothetical protein
MKNQVIGQLQGINVIWYDIKSLEFSETRPLPFLTIVFSVPFVYGQIHIHGLQAVDVHCRIQMCICIRLPINLFSYCKKNISSYHVVPFSLTRLERLFSCSQSPLILSIPPFKFLEKGWFRRTLFVNF